MSQREIEFRGKRIDNGEWVYGYLFKTWEQTYILWGTTNDVPNMIEVDPDTVGQYTGLQDRNGKEIYEKDIMKCDSNGVKHYELRVVCYDIFQCKFKAVPLVAYHQNAGSGGWTGYDLKYHNEVLGNVFTHPHLLQEQGERAE